MPFSRNGRAFFDTSTSRYFYREVNSICFTALTIKKYPSIFLDLEVSDFWITIINHCDLPTSRAQLIIASHEISRAR